MSRAREDETRTEKATRGGPPAQKQPWPGRTDEMTPVPDHGEDSYVGAGKLDGRVALVTGGDSGIGRAICLAYAREGADVAINYLDEHDDAHQTADLVRAAQREPLLIPADLTLRVQCQQVVAETVARFGQLDILVSNGAFQNECAFEDIDPQQLERTFRTNVFAAIHLIQSALPHMKPGASIILTGSVVAFEGSPRLVDYACTKAALHNLTKSLAEALADRQIRVNCVAPGPVWTPLIPATLDRKHVGHFGADTAFKRPAQPAEIAPSYVFLASDDGRYYTGEVLAPTGRTTSR
jgi:NAD(P)-dependent dehydrogenase (short-subunit alcohol dehydrogenase family)